MSKRISRSRAGSALLLFLLMALALVACRQSPVVAPTPLPSATPPPPTATPLPPTPAPTATAEPVAETAASAAQGGEGLLDSLWVLVAFGDPDNPTVVEENTLVTLILGSDGTLSGSGGCNNYSAPYDLTADGALAVGTIASTQSLCERGMEQEQAYLAVLPSARQVAIDESQRLQIAFGSRNERMTFVRGEIPLTGTPWTLIAFGDPADPPRVEAGTAITALFTASDSAQGTVTGFAGCNSYTASYRREQSTLEVRNPASTRQACPLGMNQEANYLRALGTSYSYRIVGQRLEVDYDGGVLIYRASGLPLTNVLWRLVAVEGQGVPDNTPITMLFQPGDLPDAGEVRGHSGCVTYRGAYQVVDGALSVTALEPAGALCSEAFAYQDAFLETLDGASGYAIYGEQLALDTPAGRLAFAAFRSPLERIKWELVSSGPLDDPQPLAEGVALEANFVRAPDKPSGLVFGETACNSYSATYAADLEEIRINAPVKAIAPACTAEQLELDNQIFLRLTQVERYRILGNNLQLATADEVYNFAVAQVEEDDPALLALDGTTWYLLSLYDRPLRDGTEITANFTIDDNGETGILSGSAGCNSYSAAITGDLTITPPASSRKSCASPAGVMEQESAYLAAVATVTGHTLSGNQLLLTTAEGILLYASQPAQASRDQSALLRDVTWYLQSFGTTPATRGDTDFPTVLFAADGTVSGFSGCNSFSGSYSTSGERMEVGPLASTQIACTEPVATQESYMLTTLQEAQSYLIASSQMQIRSAGGILNFSAVPPAGDSGSAPPEAVINAPTAAQVGQAITFDGSASSGGRPIIKYMWNFGDGGRASGPVVQHAYSSSGAFVVELLIADDRGASATVTQQIQVTAATGAPPTAAIAGPASAQARETVTFSAAGSAPGANGSLRYTWFFGDGSSVDSGTAAEVSYVYSAPGIYQVSVLVTDGDGRSDSASTTITISGGLEQTAWVWGEGSAPITIRFSNGMVTGFAGCNNYNATYTLQGDQLRITQPFSGDRQCPAPVMEQEQRFLSALPQVTTFQISGNMLTLSGAGGQQAVFFAQN